MGPSHVLLDHFVAPVFDAAATLRFYTGVLQLPLADAITGDDWGGFPWLMMLFATSDGRHIALVALRGAKKPPDDGLPRDARHLAFAVPSHTELGALKRRLHAHAIAYWEEDHGEQRSVYFSDPSGIILEVTAPPVPMASTRSADAAAIVHAWLREGQA